MDSRSANVESKPAVSGTVASSATTGGQQPPASTQTQKSYPKDLLPASLSSLAPHGPINKSARSTGEQAALDKRVHEILQSMASSSPGSDGARGSNASAGVNGRGARGTGGAGGSGGAATQELTAAVRQMIKEAYSGQAVAVNEHLARKRRRMDQLDAQLAQLRDEHEMEVRVIRASLRQQQEEREKKGVSAESPASMPNVDAKTLGETEAEDQKSVDATGTLKKENIGITEGSSSALLVNANPATNASGSKDDTAMKTDSENSKKLAPSVVTGATTTTESASVNVTENASGGGKKNQKIGEENKSNNNDEDEHEEGEIGMTD